MYDWRCPTCGTSFGTADLVATICPNCGTDVKNEIDQRQVDIFKEELRKLKEIKGNDETSQEEKKALIRRLWEIGTI